MYTNKIPHEDITLDDLGLREILLQGGTVDVMAVSDIEARSIVTRFLREGGACV